MAKVYGSAAYLIIRETQILHRTMKVFIKSNTYNCPTLSGFGSSGKHHHGWSKNRSFSIKQHLVPLDGQGRKIKNTVLIWLFESMEEIGRVTVHLS